MYSGSPLAILPRLYWGPGIGERVMGATGPASRSEAATGYLTSALVFITITALWALIVRDDPYYRLTDLFGVRVPAILLAYLFFMPLFGFVVGRWRYQSPHRGGALGALAKASARAIQFTYVHLLIVLFTIAMATDMFLGLNIDDKVRQVDDRLFDVAARFAPWLAAYLAGFNLGRAFSRPAPETSADTDRVKANFAAEDDRAVSAPAKTKPARKERASLPRRAQSRREEPAFENSFFEPADHAIAADDHVVGDLGLADKDPQQRLTASGLPQQPLAASNDEPGFLPPQDFNRLRPGLKQLR